MTEQDSATTISQTAQGQAQSGEQLSGQQSSQQASFSEDQLRIIDEVVRRTVQSDKDRAVSRIEKTQAAQASEIQKIADMVKSGMSAAQIEDRMLLDTIKAERSTPPQTQTQLVQTSTNGGRTAMPVDYAKVYDALGLSATDPEVVRTTAAHVNDEGKLKAALTDLLIRRKTSQTTSVGAVIQTGGGMTADTQQQLVTKTQEIQRLLRDPSTPAETLRKANEEMAALRKSLG